MATRQLRLIGTTAVIDAVREAGVHLVATEVEIRLTGVPHWPAADAIVKIEQAGLLGDVRAGAGRHKPTRRRGRNGGLLIAGALTQKSAGAD